MSAGHPPGKADIPIVGVARSGWLLEQLRDRARESVEQQGGIDPVAFRRLSERLPMSDSWVTL